MTSARQTGFRPGEALALHNLGWGLANVGATGAFDCLREASAIRQEMNDPDGQATAALALSEAHYKVHGPQAAYDHSLRSLELIRTIGRCHTLTAGLNNRGVHCSELGKLDEATECFQEALGILTAIGGGQGHGAVVENLGRVHLKSSRFREAITSLSEAYRLHLAQGHLLGQAYALRELGKAQRGAGQADKARESLQAALALFKGLEDAAEIDDIRSAIAKLSSSSSAPDKG